MLRPVVFVLITSLFLASSSKAQVAPGNPAVTQLEFSESISDPKIKTGYDGKVIKRNIVWISDEINVSKPLRSFGGVIILFANKISIDQPIDSRVYVNHSHIEPFDPPVDKKLPGIYLEVQHQEKYRQILDDYYSHCFDCFTDSSGNVFIPELPSGKTPDTNGFLGTFNSAPGSRPPDEYIDQATAQSGDIYIFTHEISINPDLMTPSTQLPAERSECHAMPTKVVPYAIDASGPRGGRGGAGMTSVCVDWPMEQHVDSLIDPICLTKGGGTSGPGGSGGNAGNVYINIVNNPDLDLSELIKKTISVAGGLPGDVHQVKTPTQAEAMNPVAPANRCSFFELGINYPPAAPGMKGRVTSNSTIGTNDAMKQLATLLRNLDSRVDYNYNEILRRAVTDPTVTSMKFQDCFTRYLTRSLVASETSVVQDAEGRIFNNTPAPEPYLAAVLRTLSVDQLNNSDLTERQLVFVRELSGFKAVSETGDQFSDYFLLNEGLMNVYDVQPFSRYTAQGARIDISTGNNLLGQEITKLDDIHSILFEHLTYVQARDFRARIDQLQQNLKKAIADAKAAQNVATNPVQLLIAIVTQLATGSSGLSSLLEALIAELELGQSTPQPTQASSAQSTNNLDKIGTSLGKSADAFRKISDLLKQPDANNPDIFELKVEIEKAVQEYNDFLTVASVTRNELFQEKYTDLLQALSLKASFESKIAVNSAQFHDLFRAIIISYLSDAASDQVALRNNLEGVTSFLNAFPIEEPYFRISPVDRQCDATTHRCLTVGPSSKWRIVYGTIQMSDTRMRLPLYVLSPRTTSVLLPTFGATIGHRDVQTVTKPPYEIIKRRLVTEPIFLPAGWTIHPE